MWDLFQQILKDKITPNQLLLLYGMKEKIAVPQIEQHKEVKGLLYEGFATINDTKVNITEKTSLITLKNIENYFQLRNYRVVNLPE